MNTGRISYQFFVRKEFSPHAISKPVIISLGSEVDDLFSFCSPSRVYFGITSGGNSEFSLVQ